MLLLFKPFQVGDYIIVNGQDGSEGTVAKVEICYTTLLSIDNKHIVIPNGTLSNVTITNVTARDQRRLEIKVGISYNADIQKAKDILEDILTEDPDTREDEEMVVFVDELAESSVIMGFRVWVDTDRYWVLADADLIQQVVYNLIDNAVKFVNEGGKLSFDFYTEGENIMVAVRNTGSGVLPEEIPRLFDRFYKTDRSRSLDKNGVGLGLSICRTIMNVHEGEIFVRSQPGEYTEFVFGLKADPAHYKKGVNRKAPMVDASFTTLPAAPAAGREEKQHEKPQQ